MRSRFEQRLGYAPTEQPFANHHLTQSLVRSLPLASSTAAAGTVVAESDTAVIHAIPTSARAVSAARIAVRKSVASHATLSTPATKVWSSSQSQSASTFDQQYQAIAHGPEQLPAPALLAAHVAAPVTVSSSSYTFANNSNPDNAAAYTTTGFAAPAHPASHAAAANPTAAAAGPGLSRTQPLPPRPHTTPHPTLAGTTNIMTTDAFTANTLSAISGASAASANASAGANSNWSGALSARSYGVASRPRYMRPLSSRANTVAADGVTLLPETVNSRVHGTWNSTLRPSTHNNTLNTTHALVMSGATAAGDKSGQFMSTAGGNAGALLLATGRTPGKRTLAVGQAAAAAAALAVAEADAKAAASAAIGPPPPPPAVKRTVNGSCGNANGDDDDEDDNDDDGSDEHGDWRALSALDAMLESLTLSFHNHNNSNALSNTNNSVAIASSSRVTLSRAFAPNETDNNLADSTADTATASGKPRSRPSSASVSNIDFTAGTPTAPFHPNNSSNHKALTVGCDNNRGGDSSVTINPLEPPIPAAARALRSLLAHLTGALLIPLTATTNAARNSEQQQQRGQYQQEIVTVRSLQRQLTAAIAAAGPRHARLRALLRRTARRATEEGRKERLRAGIRAWRAVTRERVCRQRYVAYLRARFTVLQEPTVTTGLVPELASRVYAPGSGDNDSGDDYADRKLSRAKTATQGESGWTRCVLNQNSQYLHF